MESSVNLPRLSTAVAPLIGSLPGKTRSYLGFILLGLATLLPFNFYIAAGPYFCITFNDASSNKTSLSLGLLYESTVILCASLTNLITVILVTVKFVPHIHKYRIYTSFIVIMVCFLLSIGHTLVPQIHFPAVFFTITMVLVMIQSVCSAVLLNCFYSLASTLPSRYIQGFGFGQALGGIFVAVCLVLSLLLHSNNLDLPMAIYLLCGIVVIISSIIVYFFLEKTHLFQIYSSATQEINNEHEPFFRETSSTDNDSYTRSLPPITIRQRLWTIYKEIKWNFWAIFLTFVATFSVFPASLSHIRPVHRSKSIWHRRLFVPTITFLLFFVFETIGRMISLKFHRPSLNRPRHLFFICISRFLFILLFAFCNFPRTQGLLEPYRKDFVYGILVVFFAVSHGYCNSLNLMYAPRRVQAELSGTVGALMMMAVASGTFVGSLLSYGVFVLYGLPDLRPGQLCPGSF